MAKCPTLLKLGAGASSLVSSFKCRFLSSDTSVPDVVWGGGGVLKNLHLYPVPR